MNILVVNDDGIWSEGIYHLAELAKRLGKVTVVAPYHQCSGMSHHITFQEDLIIRKAEIPVEGVDAYSVAGTPADCTRVGLQLMGEDKPDVIFSGINKGFNIAYETWFSGTVAAAMEASLYGIPSIAFSQHNYDSYEVIDAYFDELMETLLAGKLEEGQIWNVNFPHCSLEETQGIQYDCSIAKCLYYHDEFHLEQLGERMYRMQLTLSGKDKEEEGTDVHALLNHYISVSKLSGIHAV